MRARCEEMGNVGKRRTIGDSTSPFSMLERLAPVIMQRAALDVNILRKAK